MAHRSIGDISLGISMVKGSQSAIGGSIAYAITPLVNDRGSFGGRVSHRGLDASIWTGYCIQTQRGHRTVVL